MTLMTLDDAEEHSHRRRIWTNEDKWQIVRETQLPGVAVAEIARRHCVNNNQLFGWIRAAEAGKLGSRMHVVPGVVASTDKGVRQATISSCAPLLDIAFYKKTRPNPDAFSRSCIEVNDQTLATIAASPSVTTVILSSPFRGQGVDNILIREDGTYRTIKSSYQITVDKLKASILAIQALGKRVVLISPPPITERDNARCVERKQSGMMILGNNPQCEVKEAGSEEKNVLALLNEISHMPGLEYVSLRDALCDGQKCKAEIDGVSIYRDRGHLSYAGSAQALKEQVCIRYFSNSQHG